MASPRPRIVYSRTGIEPANDDTDTTVTMSINGVFHLSVGAGTVGTAASNPITIPSNASGARVPGRSLVGSQIRLGEFIFHFKYSSFVSTYRLMHCFF